VQLATLLGRPAEGERLWRELSARIDAAAARVPAGWRGKRVYFEVASAPYAAGEASFVGETLARLGLGNVVPASMGPFPKLNPEFVVRARPDVMMASASGLAEMPRRPGWSAIPALANGQQCGFPTERYEFLVRPGPRLAEAAEVIVQCLISLPPTR
jgi:iron complex transport system substrate-binding protein